MKSLALSRPLVIMVVGIPGAGKSFFARQFADTFGAPVVSYDRLRSSIFAEPTFSRGEDDVLLDITDYEINELLKTHKTFLIDGGVNSRMERAAIERRARLHDYRTLIVWVQTDEPTCRFRATKRSSKRKGDEWNSSMTAEIFNTIARRLVSPLRSEPQVVISGKHTYATQAKVVLKKLVSPREEDAQILHAPDRTPNNDDQTPPAHRRSITIT
jgi:predicted kinase